MKIDQRFEVVFETNRYPKEDRSINHEGVLSDKVEKVDLKFSLSEKEAGYFLFRFYPGFFEIEDYKTIITFDQSNKLQKIVFTKDDYIYITTNLLKALSDIHEGYFRLITMNKINDIMEFDFNIPEDNDTIHEEFEDEE